MLIYVRKWRLREEYSLLWLLLAAAMVILASFEGITVWIADRLDVVYAPSILFFIALAFVATMLFHLLAGDLPPLRPEPAAGAGAEPPSRPA